MTFARFILRCAAQTLVFLSVFSTALAQEYTEAQAPLPTARATIHTANKAIDFQLEIADEPEEMMRGLMFRQSMPADHGMLFVYTDQKPHYMWMKNTLIPLDMLFLDDKGKIVHIEKAAAPHSLEPRGVDRPTSAVIELNGGTAEKLHLSLGDRVTLSPLQEPHDAP